MAKPGTSLITWGTNSGVREAPSTGLKASGFSAGQLVPDGINNFLFGLLFDWLGYLSNTKDDSVKIIAGMLPWVWTWHESGVVLQTEGDGTASVTSTAHNTTLTSLRQVPNSDVRGTLSVSATAFTCDQVAAITTGLAETFTIAGGATGVALSPTTQVRLQKGSANATNSNGFTVRAVVPNMFAFPPTVAGVDVSMGSISGAGGSSAITVTLMDGAANTEVWYLDPSAATPSADNTMTRIGSAATFSGPVSVVFVATLDGSAEGDLMEINNFNFDFS